MKIKEIIWQHRRDFTAILECDHCGNEQLLEQGYDDAYFHSSVIPSIKCEGCGEIAGDDYVPLKTKYPEGWQV